MPFVSWTARALAAARRPSRPPAPPAPRALPLAGAALGALFAASLGTLLASTPSAARAQAAGADTAAAPADTAAPAPIQDSARGAAAAAAGTERYVIAARELAIFNLAGVVRVETSTDSTIALEIVRRGRDSARLRVDTGSVGGRLTLRVVYPGGLVVYPEIGGTSAEVLLSDDGRFRDASVYSAGGVGRRVAVKGVGAGTEAAADIVARIPAGSKLSVYLAAGHLIVTDVMAALELDSRAAQVDVQGVRGPLRIVSWTGGVRVRDVDGPVAVDGGVGGVDLGGIRGPRLAVDAGIGAASVSDVDVGDLALWVGPGRVSLADIRAANIQAALGSGSLDLALAGDVQSMKVEAASGDVTVHASEAVGAEIEVRAGAGAFSTNLPIEVSERRDERLRSYVSGKLGDGQGRIEIASAGSVKLLKEAAR